MTSESSTGRAIEGVEAWLTLVDQVLQGVHHALNNRIGSLSAMIELFQLADAPPDSANLEALSGDLARFGEANKVLRLLPRDAPAGEEPLILDDVLADVFVIHRFLHDFRDLQVTIVPTRFVEPVRCERSALLHVLTSLLMEVKRWPKSRPRSCAAS